VLRPQEAQGEWQKHSIRQGNGKGGWVSRPALRQVLKHPASQFTMPFGLVQMDNGEIAILCSSEKPVPKGPRSFEPAVAFSKDGGATWSAFMIIPGAKGRPHFLESLGGGRLSFITEVFGTPDKPLNDATRMALAQRIFSNDYGRTWKEVADQQLTKDGRTFGVEGNGWVDRDTLGTAKAI